LTYVSGQVTFAVSPLIRGKISLARKILLADDSVTAQNMGRKILADAGYEVITVNNGSAALKKIAELKPDLVILDVYMPGYSGLEVCQRLKESQESSRIPVLLTVGKLEPFKPEEAQRVRAEGFIVKPFEASELLSALSKLEDKVVPRAEPSKPGRFARAIAAAEESGRGGRNEVPGGDDDGWKSRISFPHKKTEAEEKAADGPSIYNPMNRDLRTVVETPAELAADKASEQAKKEDHEEKRQPVATAAEASVDVAALVPPGLPQAGLPQDVTPEEVAAITAAAAQIQMLGTALKAEISEAPRSEALASAPKPSAEDQVERSVPSQPHATSDLTPAISVEAKAEAIAEPEKQNEDKVESVATEAAAISPGVRSNGNGNESERDNNKDRLDEAQDLPVTMAATAEFASIVAANAGASRWTAVPVALEGDEATISLEQEMQKAYAAFVAEETAAAAVATLPAPEAAAPENSIAPAEATPDVPVAAISTPEPGAPQPQPAVNAVAPESESVPSPQFEPAAGASSLQAAEPDTHLAATHLESAPESMPQPEAAFTAPAVSDFAPAAEYTQPSPTAELVEQPSEPISEPLGPTVETAAPDQAQPTAESMPVAAETAASGYAFAPVVAEPIVNELVAAEPIVSAEPAGERMEESESVKSTAAAWASWRQIRDTGEAKADTESAAMAVAAGAEQIAQESAAAPPENPQDVASIVDSVLADLRPRLMAEISRKMSEKK
jgi:CheY-like chemotaxis protein